MKVCTHGQPSGIGNLPYDQNSTSSMVDYLGTNRHSRESDYLDGKAFSQPAPCRTAFRPSSNIFSAVSSNWLANLP
jgi:hypothetical protein